MTDYVARDQAVFDETRRALAQLASRSSPCVAEAVAPDVGECAAWRRSRPRAQAVRAHTHPHGPKVNRRTARRVLPRPSLSS